MKSTGDQQLLKRINRSHLLRLVRAQPGLSRAQLASESGLTKSTVSLLVRELIEESWLAELATTAASGQGRPSTPLQVDPNTRGLIGVDIAVGQIRVVGVSLLGEVLCASETPLRSDLPIQVCQQTAELVARTYTELTLRGTLLSGVGVALPGAFDERSGVLRFAPNLGWRNVDFVPLMTHALLAAGLPSVPVHIQNEADTGALSEYEFSREESREALIYVTCDVGVGAGIVLNDRLYTGAQGMAGEIGHSILQLDGPLCSCGRRGCAEAFLGAKALKQQRQQSGGLDSAGRLLGMLMQNLWTSFNPGALVLGGASCLQHPELVSMAQQTLNDYARSAGMTAPPVRMARYGLLASAVGAAALVLHQYLRPWQGPRASVQPERAAQALL